MSPILGDEIRHPEGWPLQTVFPSKPTVSEQQVANSSYFGRATLRKNGQLYGLQRITFLHSEAPTGREKGYAAVKKLYLTRPNLRLEKEEDVAVAGLPARRMVFFDAETKRIADIRIVYLGNESYDFLYDRPASDDPSEESHVFFSDAKRANKSPEPTR